MKNLNRILLCVLTSIVLAYPVAGSAEEELNVEMKVQRVTSCFDTTTEEQIPARCVFYVMDGLSFSMSLRLGDGSAISHIYYPPKGESRIVDRAEIRALIKAKQREKSI